ncbi:MAG: hypothetical protein A2X86_18890 [Bdellovibrionales bacterium GWA2_49_15]|nr:MAG: hypothetical protein A2X86_18890 [Bdellovibrionales bacterium GWA2_49_15]
MPLNSLENRVIEVELSDPLPTGEKSIVVKFYRPGRWRREAILEDHAFSQRSSDSGMDVITPVPINNNTLLTMQQEMLYWAIYPKVRGQLVDEPTIEQLQILGLKIAQLHEIGATFQAKFRPKLTVDNYAQAGLDNLLQFKLLPSSLQASIKKVGAELIRQIALNYSSSDSQSSVFQTIHGDLHYGNILWNEGRPFITDFDDMMVGPLAQDIWMLTNVGSEEEVSRQAALLSGYEEYRPFPRSTLPWCQSLKAMRYMHYLGWVCKRWEDPIFKQTFVHYENSSFWEMVMIDFENMARQLQSVREFDPFGNY